MLTCKDISVLSDDYLENSLPFKKKASVSLHLAICKHCRHYLRNLQATVDIVRQSDGTLVNGSTVDHTKIDDIMRRIEAEVADKK